MDIYNIPNDTGGTWRMDKLIEYRKAVDYVDLPIFREFAKAHYLTLNEQIMCALFFSITYSEVSALWLYDNMGYRYLTDEGIDKFWRENKHRIQFSSARTYCKNMDYFPSILKDFTKLCNMDPLGWFTDVLVSNRAYSAEDAYRAIFNELKLIRYMGRFSAELFLLVLEAFQDAGIFPFKIKSASKPFKWKDGSKETSGMLNLLYMDEEADRFDKEGYLDPHTIELLDEGLATLTERCIQMGYKNDTYSDILPRVCSFRNVIKCRRYAGYHHDRQLEQINAYLNDEDMFSVDTTYFILGARRVLYPEKLLGEIRGWNGVRPERKKLFREKGVLGFETAD